MGVHFQRELERLQRQILTLGAEVQLDVSTAVRSVVRRDLALARTAIAREELTNTMEVDIEEECLKILALYQPVATDLRHVVAALKINQNLERIGDLAVHVAERGIKLAAHPPMALPPEIEAMAGKAQGMLKRVLDAFVTQDSVGAHAVCTDDAEIDVLRRAVNQQVEAEVKRNPAMFEPLVQIMHIARHLERIADHATNFAEDLIYQVEGRIVRHTAEVSDAGKQELG